MTKKRLESLLRELTQKLTSDAARGALSVLKQEVKAMPDDVAVQSLGELPLPSEVQARPNRFGLFSDGACRGNPGPGAWGMLGQDHQGQLLFEASGVEMLTTNNRMELMGAIESLRALQAVLAERSLAPKDVEVYLYSDSRYVLDGLNSWLESWKARGWKKADKKPPENLELWQELDELRAFYPSLSMVWVKGHSGHPQNEKCDWLANQALDEAGL